MSEPVRDTWAVVELMGHVKIAGKLLEEEKFGSKLGRLDIPQADGSFITQYFGGGSVYRISVVSEDVARHVSRSTSPAPVSPWDFPKMLPSPEVIPARGYDRDVDFACNDEMIDNEDDEGVE